MGEKTSTHLGYFYFRVPYHLLSSALLVLLPLECNSDAGSHGRRFSPLTPYRYYATAVLRIGLSRGETVVVLFFRLRVTGR